MGHQNSLWVNNMQTTAARRRRVHVDRVFYTIIQHKIGAHI